MVGVVISTPLVCGGAERRIGRIFTEIARQRSDIEFLLGGPNEGIDSFLENLIPDYDHITIRRFSRVRYIVPYVLKKHYDVLVYVDPTLFSLIINPIGKIIRTKTLLILANGYIAFGVYSKIKLLIAKLSIITASHVDCLYPAAKDFLDKHYRKDITFTPNSFTDLNKFVPKEKEDVMIFSAARLEKLKNPILLIDALSQIKDVLQKEKYKFLICGQGGDFEYLKKHSEKLGLSGLLTFTGAVKMEDYLPCAKVFFSLQIVGNCPSQVLQEAAASGCYCIVTNVSDSYKMLDPSFGELIDLSPNALSKAILTYINLPDVEAKKCIPAARSFAEKNFTIDANLPYFNSILNNLLSELKKR